MSSFIFWEVFCSTQEFMVFLASSLAPHEIQVRSPGMIDAIHQIPIPIEQREVVIHPEGIGR